MAIARYCCLLLVAAAFLPGCRTMPSSPAQPRSAFFQGDNPWILDVHLSKKGIDSRASTMAAAVAPDGPVVPELLGIRLPSGWRVETANPPTPSGRLRFVLAGSDGTRIVVVYHPGEDLIAEWRHGVGVIMGSDCAEAFLHSYASELQLEMSALATVPEDAKKLPKPQNDMVWALLWIKVLRPDIPGVIWTGPLVTASVARLEGLTTRTEFQVPPHEITMHGARSAQFFHAGSGKYFGVMTLWASDGASDAAIDGMVRTIVGTATPPEDCVGE